MDRAKIYFSIAAAVASVMECLNLIAIIRLVRARDIFGIFGVFGSFSLETLPTLNYEHIYYPVLANKECFNSSFLTALGKFISVSMDFPRSSTNSKINTAYSNLRPSQSCPDFSGMQFTSALAFSLSRNFNTSSPVQSNYNFNSGRALVQTNTGSSETPNRIFGYIARQAVINNENNRFIREEEFSGATAYRAVPNDDLVVEYGDSSFDSRFGMFRRESLEQILPLMTILPMAYNLANGVLGSASENSFLNSSMSSDSISGTSSDSFTDEAGSPAMAVMSNDINNPIENFRVQAREEFPFVGDFRPRLAFTNTGRNIYDNDLEWFGRGRGRGLITNDSMSVTYNDTPSSESFIGRGRGIIGRGRGVFTTSSSDIYDPDYFDPRAGRGARRGMERWGIGGRGGGRGRGMNRRSFGSSGAGSWG